MPNFSTKEPWKLEADHVKPSTVNHVKHLPSARRTVDLPPEGDTFHAQRRDVKDLQDAVTQEFLEAGGAKTKMLAGMSTKATMNGYQSQRGISPMLG